MKFIPILFSTPMVQAILDGRKSQTRRMVKPQPSLFFPKGSVTPDGLLWKGENTCADQILKACPYGQPGDVLWVRESWFTHWKYDDVAPSNLPADAPFFYLQNLERGEEGRLRPCIHMPKAACRIWLQVKSVRVERLQDISREDCISEGIAYHQTTNERIRNRSGRWYDYERKTFSGLSIGKISPSMSFNSLWKSINGSDSWDANPWVWVIEFERLTEKPEGF